MNIHNDEFPFGVLVETYGRSVANVTKISVGASQNDTCVRVLSSLQD
jgi:hypothetical protein